MKITNVVAAWIPLATGANIVAMEIMSVEAEAVKVVVRVVVVEETAAADADFSVNVFFRLRLV